MTVNSSQNLGNLIYEIRDQQVMLDSDLAKLYQMEAKRKNSEKRPRLGAPKEMWKGILIIHRNKEAIWL